MFILSSVVSGLEFWSLNHTSLHENSELKVFLKDIFLGNWSNDLQGKTIYKTLESCLQTLLTIDKHGYSNFWMRYICTIFIFCYLTFSASK